MIHTGDNLQILMGMRSESVDLVYLDPPFCTGRDFGKFDDRWGSSSGSEYAGGIPAIEFLLAGAYMSHGRGMMMYLDFMAARLVELHRVLKSTGSIYLHCDPTASHYLKMLMDAIFGARNFRNEVVWAYTGPSNVSRHFPRKHDSILFYAKSDDTAFNKDAIRVPYKNLNVQHAKSGGGGIGGDLTSENVDGYIERGKVIEDWWTDCSPVGRLKKERTGYPTQKPLALLERIIKASSNEGDVVLDPFCGSGTTLVAADRLNRKWVGIDISEDATMLARERVVSKRP